MTTYSYSAKLDIEQINLLEKALNLFEKYNSPELSPESEKFRHKMYIDNCSKIISILGRKWEITIDDSESISLDNIIEYFVKQDITNNDDITNILKIKSIFYSDLKQMSWSNFWDNFMEELKIVWVMRKKYPNDNPDEINEKINKLSNEEINMIKKKLCIDE